jgi:hypothetical protein
LVFKLSQWSEGGGERAIVKSGVQGFFMRRPDPDWGALSRARFYKWQAKFGGIDESLVVEMKDMWAKTNL